MCESVDSLVVMEPLGAGESPMEVGFLAAMRRWLVAGSSVVHSSVDLLAEAESLAVMERLPVVHSMIGPGCALIGSCSSVLIACHRWCPTRTSLVMMVSRT
jgi:hypothetical protein